MTTSTFIGMSTLIGISRRCASLLIMVIGPSRPAKQGADGAVAPSARTFHRRNTTSEVHGLENACQPTPPEPSHRRRELGPTTPAVVLRCQADTRPAVGLVDAVSRSERAPCEISRRTRSGRNSSVGDAEGIGDRLACSEPLRDPLT